MTRWTTLLLLTATAALAEPADPRGWTKGTVAAGAARILAGPDRSKLPELDFPKAFAKQLQGKTLLFYFSPTCPHCQAVGEELGDLDRALPDDVTVIGVATGRSLPADLAGFKTTYGIDFDIVVDEDGGIGAAMGARSTPSVVLVEPAETKGKHAIVDLWYPYQPGYATYVRMRAAPDPWSVFGGYLGNGACVGCHQQETEAWALSHHSIAWKTLVDDEKHTDPECVACHVTGHGQEGGWTPDPQQSPDLTGVGCEACHGPSGPHDGVKTDAKASCATCHDAKHSIQFSVEKGLPLIDHYAANGIDDEAWRTRRMAVIDGKAPRPLLDFAADPTAGAEACKDCHEAEYAQWASSGHRKAMGVLEKDGKATEPGCVACHATATRGGPRPTELSGFRVDEGVGCEACHGPGGAHIAAKGGTDNIEGLGEDCPVCVIEALCTSCHTAEMDRDWDLDTHLPLAGHGTTKRSGGGGE
jgi:thiol-disulfide isomerase/thioredoxin